MLALVLVVVCEGFDLSFKVAGQEVVFQQYPVLESLVPTLNFALGLEVIWCAARELHAFVLQPFSQISGNLTGSVVAEQTWLVTDMNLIAT